RTFVYADDLVRALMLVMEKGSAGEVYNIGGDKEVTMRELAEIIIKLTGHTGAITFVPHFVDDHTHRMPSLKKIKKLGWKQTVLLEDGLKRMIANFGLRRSAAVPVPALSTTEAA
ncbi:MAG: NAD-dependent epimerase/dehydratase family protein, partial [Parcubacteria group bacterium]|nr:NAD-dependent epimerase/dehydratase family protein [Parcubacteria group bacterium]